MTQRSYFIAMLVLLLALTVPAFAQEAAGAAEAPAETVSGAATLMLLIGAGAVLAVAGLTMMRENAGKK
ncbi:MAG: hypothetical protein L6Q98_12055 [Anaerolineae bacterium]|nr:hypothetical protein [Anaerolineae bacterium]NUQ05746.1 hypothetical protein [Anaerolineae bacterium]